MAKFQVHRRVRRALKELKGGPAARAEATKELKELKGTFFSLNFGGGGGVFVFVF